MTNEQADTYTRIKHIEARGRLAELHEQQLRTQVVLTFLFIAIIAVCIAYLIAP